ncbi:unnamed protein product [Cochlearia groenlandica]
MEDTISMDSISLLLSHNNKNTFFDFERGPRYGEYSRLREFKLLMKRDYEKILKEEEERFFGLDQAVIKKKPTRQIRVSSPEKTRFGFFNNPPPPTTNPNRRRSSLGQSMPDFSAAIRKENRLPVNSNSLPRRTDLTPPPPQMKTRNAVGGSPSSTKGSVSASGGEKKKSKTMMGMAARKSYANVEDLKKIATAAASAINGGGRKSIGGGRKSIGGGGRNFMGFRQIY